MIFPLINDLPITIPDTLFLKASLGVITLDWTAVSADAQPKKGRIIVATQYINIARQHYAERGRQAKFIKLYGAMELAPILNLADEIVDIVDTGNTLRANGLVTREHIADVSSRVIVNRAAMKTKFAEIDSILSALRSAMEEYQ